MPGRLRAVLCSGNPHKLSEFRALFPDWDLELLCDPGGLPPEHGTTYRENALLKARHGQAVGPPDLLMLADDSGLEVVALGGAPGVETARWARGRHVERLLEALSGVTERAARYVCELVALGPDNRQALGRGVLEGTIAAGPAGGEGFGFDPVFVPSGETRTVAELGDAWKAQHSHRALAARALCRALSADVESAGE